MKIALLCDRYPPRPHTGIGAFVQMLARGLYQRGHGIVVVEIGDCYAETFDQRSSFYPAANPSALGGQPDHPPAVAELAVRQGTFRGD